MKKSTVLTALFLTSLVCNAQPPKKNNPVQKITFGTLFTSEVNTRIQDTSKSFIFSRNLFLNFSLLNKKTYHGFLYDPNTMLKVVNGLIFWRRIGIYSSLVKKFKTKEGYYAGIGLEKFNKARNPMSFMFSELGINGSGPKYSFKIGLHVNLEALTWQPGQTLFEMINKKKKVSTQEQKL